MKKKLELNLNIPLLSVRRQLQASNYQEEDEDHKHTAGCIVGAAADDDDDDDKILVSEGVPFSWEQAPGKPKPIPSSINQEEEEDYLQHSNNTINVVELDVDEIDDDDDDHGIRLIKEGEEEEVASLSEAIDILELQRARHDKMEVVVVDMEQKQQLLQRRRPISPSFIINRFLPDANALAQEYSICYGHHLSSYSSSSSVVATPMTSTAATIKQGCGLDNIFPWRTKRTTR